MVSKYEGVFAIMKKRLLILVLIASWVTMGQGMQAQKTSEQKAPSDAMKASAGESSKGSAKTQSQSGDKEIKDNKVASTQNKANSQYATLLPSAFNGWQAGKAVSENGFRRRRG